MGLQEPVYLHPQFLIRALAGTNISTGRTTFVNTLCGKRVLKGKDSDDPHNAHVEDGVKIQPVTVGEQCLWVLMQVILQVLIATRS